MKKIRKEFPVLAQNTYLNTASSGLLYDSLMDYRQEHDFDFLIGGSMFRESSSNFLNSVRQSIGDFFTCDAKNIVLTQNFSLGLNTVLQGLDNTKKVLILDEDYPSVNFAVTNKGFDVCCAKIDAKLEENIKAAIQKNRPDIFVFSVVQFTNGILIDLNFIKQLKSEYPNLLIIADGTQFCGTQIFDFKSSGIDILGCSGYKWLLGGYGNGFILFNDNILEDTTPDSYIQNAKETDYDPSYTNLKARFECGHLDTFSFGSLQYSLQFLSKTGQDIIQQNIRELAEYTHSKLTKLHLLEASVLKRKKHSSIFNIKGDQKLFNYLREKDIITSMRGNGIRISLHFYNTKEEIDILLDALHRYR
ncbi:aminotransferase class V-fold PLP-dependent enzyme [Aquimarina addita]